MIYTKFDADRTNSLGRVRKSRFSDFRDFARKRYTRKWAWPISRDSAQFPERLDVRFLIVRCTVWEL